MFQSEILRVCEPHLEWLPTVDGRYKLVRDVGVSRFGKVYLAVDLDCRKLVALKSLLHWQNRDAHLQMFLNEMANLVKIRRAGGGARVCNLLGFNFHGRYSSGKRLVYYVMEFKEMGDLLSLVDSLEQNLSARLVGFFHQQICLALRDIHRAQIAHLDLKPENIVVDEHLNLFLCDFGHSLDVSQKLLAVSKAKKALPASQLDRLASKSFVGSDQYCAPEVHEFQTELDEPEPDAARVRQCLKSIDFFKCDVFGAGVVLFVQLHKTFPFNKAQMEDLHFRTMVQKPQVYWKSFQSVRSLDHDFRDYFYQACETLNSKRASTAGLLEHPWLLENRHWSAEDAREEMKAWLWSKKEAFLQELIESFKDQTRFRKVLGLGGANGSIKRRKSTPVARSGPSRRKCSTAF